MTNRESKAINIARFFFMIGVLFIHFPIKLSAADGIFLTPEQTPVYNLISSPFFLSLCCLQGLFLMSGYLYFKTYNGLNYGQKLDNRIKTLIVPYLFWNFFWLVYNLLKSYKMQGLGVDLLQINSVGDIFTCFWKKGFGSHPNYPIAGYMWFIRDLIVFAFIAPMYGYFLSKKKTSWILLLVLCICTLNKGWHIPGFNFWLYLGGMIAAQGTSLEKICDSIRFRECIILFVATNAIALHFPENSSANFLMICASIFIVMKIALQIYDRKILLKISASSTWLYVTHIFILNASRHSLAKIMSVNDDFTMCTYYVINAVMCILICLISFYILKKFDCQRILAITTGGRG